MVDVLFSSCFPNWRMLDSGSSRSASLAIPNFLSPDLTLQRTPEFADFAKRTSAPRDHG
jgi:hypothetical protein